MKYALFGVWLAFTGLFLRILYGIWIYTSGLSVIHLIVFMAYLKITDMGYRVVYDRSN